MPPLVFEEVPLARAPRGSSAGRPDHEPLPAGTFSLAVEAHQTVAVTGDEVSGVDYLGGLAMGLELPAGGRVLTLGEEVARLPRSAQLAFRRRVGYLPAGDGLLQNLTLRDNIRLPLRFGSNFRPKDIEGRVDVIVAQLRLSRVADLRPAEANAEDRRRAALGRALAFDPELVIAEDPFEGLTERASAELLEAARGGETAEGGRRTVLVTGPGLPGLLRTRVDRALRVVRGVIEEGR
jgi:putative ABC transport system ATP-binding protein